MPKVHDLFCRVFRRHRGDLVAIGVNLPRVTSILRTTKRAERRKRAYNGIDSHSRLFLYRPRQIQVQRIERRLDACQKFVPGQVLEANNVAVDLYYSIYGMSIQILFVFAAALTLDGCLTLVKEQFGQIL